MNREYVYRMERLDGTDKKGVLLPDADGNYTMCIGALESISKNINPLTGQNEYYSAEGASKFFGPGTSLNEQIKGGYFRGEYGHPKRDGMNDLQFMERNMYVDERLTCCTFTEIWLVPNYLDKNTGQRVIGIMAKFKPTGPYADALKRDLETPGINVSFSIRALTTRKFINGRHCKVLVKIISFDFVNEQGIPCAEKLVSPSCESVNRSNTVVDGEIDFSLESAKAVLSNMEKHGVSTENFGYAILAEAIAEQSSSQYHYSNYTASRQSKSFTNW